MMGGGIDDVSMLMDDGWLTDDKGWMLDVLVSSEQQRWAIKKKTELKEKEKELERSTPLEPVIFASTK